MKNHTKLFEKDRKKELRGIQEELEQCIEDFQDQIDSHEVEVQLADLKLEHFNEARLQEQAVFYKNHTLLNDCKITKDFIRNWSYQIKQTQKTFQKSSLTLLRSGNT